MLSNKGTILQTSCLKKTALYRRRFKAGRPFHHVVIPNAFAPADLTRLKRALARGPFKKAGNHLFSAKVSEWLEHPDPFLRKWVRRFYQQAVPWMEKVTGIPVSPVFLILRFYSYKRGNYLRPHKDKLGNRAVSFVLPLHDLKPHEGGRLVYLKALRGGEFKTLKRNPFRFNHLMLFEVGSKSWHQIEPLRTSKRRLTLSGWLFHRRSDTGLLKDLKSLPSQKRVRAVS